MIHVCSLARLHDTIETTGARYLVTLLGHDGDMRRPERVPPENHLWLRMHDISLPADGFLSPESEHIERLVDFVRAWDRTTPMVVHCFAGISRSTAAAFVSVCALNPHREEKEVAWTIRESSPTASPNLRLVTLADHVLARNGRMISAIGEIGRGEYAAEGVPFRLSLV